MNRFAVGVLLVGTCLFLTPADVTATPGAAQEPAASPPRFPADATQASKPTIEIPSIGAAETKSGQVVPFSQETNGTIILHSLRMYRAAQQGKTAIERCSGMTGTPPLPTPRDFQSYYDPFGANLDVAASFGDTGVGGIPSAQNSIQTEALGLIQFESEHFLYNYASCLDRRPTLSFGGTVGIVPALVMENLTSTTATIAVPNNRPMFQDAFAWSLGPKVNIATSHFSQADLFANLGESYLIS